jgi:hypothetical protein
MSPRAARRQTQTTATMTAAPPMDNTVTGSPTSSPQSRLDRISQRAYALYERRGGNGGSAEDDWFQAEREIDSEA